MFKDFNCSPTINVLITRKHYSSMRYMMKHTPNTTIKKQITIRVLMFSEQTPRNQIEGKNGEIGKKEKSCYLESLAIKKRFLLSTDHSVSTQCRTLNN